MLLGSNIVVYREPGEWKGPYVLKKIENHEYTVRINNRDVVFRLTYVKPFQERLASELTAEKHDNLTEPNSENDEGDSDPVQDSDDKTE